MARLPISPVVLWKATLSRLVVNSSGQGTLFFDRKNISSKNKEMFSFDEFRTEDNHSPMVLSIALILVTCIFIGALFYLNRISGKSHAKVDLLNQQINQIKKELADKNMVIEKNKLLTETNHELIKHNNELSQFAYTVSHNLRGPVASMIGLVQMIEMRDADSHQGQVQEHLKNSINNLDTIIRDLGKIIDIRNDSFSIRQKSICPKSSIPSN